MKIVIAGRYDRHDDSGAAARLYVAYSLEEYQAGNESAAVAGIGIRSDDADNLVDVGYVVAAAVVG